MKRDRMIFNRDGYLRQSSRLRAWGWLLFLGGITMLVVDATTAESKQKIAEYGFENHGLVIFDSERRVRKKMDGHKWTEPQIRTALSEVLLPR